MIKGGVIFLHFSLKLTTQEDWTVLIYSMNSSDPGIKLSTEQALGVLSTGGKARQHVTTQLTKTRCVSDMLEDSGEPCLLSWGGNKQIKNILFTYFLLILFCQQSQYPWLMYSTLYFTPDVPRSIPGRYKKKKVRVWFLRKEQFEKYVVTYVSNDQWWYYRFTKSKKIKYFSLYVRESLCNDVDSITKRLPLLETALQEHLFFI